MRSLIARSLMVALSVGVLAVSHQANAQTDSAISTPFRVFGNDGLGIGRLPLGGLVPSLAGETHTILAQGFKTGAKPYTLVSVDIGLYFDETFPVLDIALYKSTTDANGLAVPDLTNRVATFNPIPTNNGGVFSTYSTILYNFKLDKAVELATNTSYWISVSYSPQVSGATAFLWNFAAGRGIDTPREQTRPDAVLSGVTYLGTVGKQDFNDVWTNHDANAYPPSSGLSISVYAFDTPSVITGGGGGGSTQTPPTLTCYAYSKGYFKNKYPSGWPTSVIANGGAVIGTQIYTIAQLRTMLDTNTTGGNQIGQLASQLVAVHLSREISRQTAGPNNLWWDGWAPDSSVAQAAYLQAAALINANAGFDSRGRLTGRVTGVSTLINNLDDYIGFNHCNTSSSSGSGGESCYDEDDEDKDDDRQREDRHKNCKKDSKGQCKKKKDGGCR